MSGATTRRRRRARSARKFGAEMVDEILVPVGTRDFSPILLKIQQAKPDIVAAAVGGDDFKVMRQQVVDMKLDRKPAWLNNQQDWPDVYGLGIDSVFGVFGTTWYHKLEAARRRRFREALSGALARHAHRCARQRLLQRLRGDARVAAGDRARRAAPTTSRSSRRSKGARCRRADRMQHHDAYIDPVSHHVQQTVYLATGNDKPVDNTDYFKILSCGRRRRRRATSTRRGTASCSPTTTRRATRCDGIAGAGAGSPLRPAPAQIRMDFILHLAAASGQRAGARPAVRAGGARLHADHRRDGGDQPRAWLAVRAGRLCRAGRS